LLLLTLDVLCILLSVGNVVMQQRNIKHMYVPLLALTPR